MSTTTLDPTVVRKLRQFGRRRFRMIAVRGLCAAIATFLTCMAFVAFLDWGWILSDNVRWGLSGAAYFLTAAVAWWVSGRKILHTPAQEEIASQVEDAEPELRENLLSAVELATDNPDAVTDSPVFRGLLQGRVSRQMAQVRVGRLLPFKLMARWIVTAVLVVAVIAALLVNGGPRLHSLAVRAMMPMANIDRVSRIQVEILQPTPNSLMIAKDETVAIVVATSGGDVDEAVLETFVPGKPPQKQTMRIRTDNEFAANIHVAEDVVEYRILAGDAVTRRHRIDGKDRPRVVAFHKTYQYPEYSGFENRTITEDHGDVVVLEGTQAQIQLDLDQEVSQAELRIDAVLSDEVAIIPLTMNPEGKWSADVPVEEDAIYKVHLVSKTTGFENVFSPRYEIRPVPDLIPRVGFVDQQETNLLLPPNDILALRGMAEDDLPPQSLEQEISINGRDWFSRPLELEQPPGPSAAPNRQPGVDDAPSANAKQTSGPETTHRITAAWSWDLLELKLKTGDQITTRLVATDLKGNRGESVPLRIVVAAPEFDPERHAVIEHKADLNQVVDRFAKVAEEHKTSALEIVKRIRDDLKAGTQLTEQEVAIAGTNLIELTRKTQQAAERALEEVQNVTRKMPAGVDAYELELAGRVILRVLHDHTNRPRHAVAAFHNAADSKERQKLVDTLKEGFERSGDDAKSLAHHYRNLVAQNIFNALAWDFDAMIEQQRLIANSPTQTFARLKRQETVVLNQLRVVEGFTRKFQNKVPDSLQRHMTQLVDWTSRWHDNLEQSMESEDKLPQLQRHVKDLLREFGDRQRYDVIDGGMANRLVQARHDLDHRSGSLTEPLSLMSTAMHQETRKMVEAGEADDSTKAEELRKQAAVFAAEVDLKIAPRLKQIRDRKTLNQSRVDSNTQFASDSGLAHRAVTSLQSQYRQDDPQESIVPTAFNEIAPAWRVLEAGHDVANMRKILKNLIQKERWQSQNLVAKTQHPRQWDAVSKGLESAVQKLRLAGVTNEIVGKFDQIRRSPATSEAARKITQRRGQRDKLVSAVTDLVDLQDQLHLASGELQPVMAEARAVIAKYAPTIPEMSRQIAQQVRDLEEQTADVADAVEADPSKAQTTEPDTDQQLAELQHDQEVVNEQIDDLFEALVEDANQQNVMEDEGRERARDADDAIAMIQDPAEQMNQQMKEAQEANSPDQQAQELSEAAEQQERTAQALETVAQHFERLENGEDVAETRAELRQQEREMEIARQMDQQFEEVERLAQMTVSTNENLMQQLEQELQNNPAMREALSEIAQNTVEEARNALDDAARQEDEIQKANERSDSDFQQKKKELAEDLRELGKDAASLASRMVAQATSAATQAKTPEAQKKFQQTQAKLNEAAQASNSSNENQQLADLTENLQKAQQAIQEATENLAEGKQQSADAKDEEIHPDDKNRQAAKKNLENQRKRFVDQLKREADVELRRRDQEEKRAANSLRTAESSLRNYDKQLQQAKQQAKQKPEDRNLKSRVAQAESRKQQAQQKVDAAKKLQEQAKQIEDVAREERTQLNSFPQQPLDDKNPAAQLAESMANEAQKQAEQLKKDAQEIARNADFGKEMTPSKQQLASASENQQRVNEDVQETSDDLARAARHERRLGKELASDALQEASDNVQDVVENEATDAKQQLDTAEAAAPDPQQGGEAPAENNNQPALAANAAVEESEQAIAQQANELTPIVEAAEAAAAAAQEAAQQPSEPAANPQPGQQLSNGDAPTQNGQQSATPQQGVPKASAPEQGTPSATPQPFTPEEIAEGRQLAQTLDELDRMQAQENALAQSQQNQPTPPGQQSPQQAPQSLAQAAQAQAAQIAQDRSQAQQESALAQESDAWNPEGMPQLDGTTGEFVIVEIDRSENSNWGKLRSRQVEDVTKGRREAVSEAYRRSVEAYFKVIAERARNK
ncbi:MAG: hypothetical protein GY878_01210 [Fuerstiella sp.]|nr:hypothetical protein [Fuerstiella sp.]